MKPASAPRLPLVSLIVAAFVIGACSSSSDGDDPAPDGGGTAAAGDADGDAGGDADGDGATGGDGTGGGSAAGGERLLDASIPSSASATSFGFVSIDQDSDVPEDSEVFASFLRLDLGLPVDQLAGEFLPPLDTCTIFRSEAEQGLPDFTDDDGDDIDFDFLDAGDNIVFTSRSAGTWLTLMRREEFGFVIYTSEEGELSLPVPGDLEFDVPGGGRADGLNFPAFSGVPVADVPPLAGVTPAGADATVDTTFGWTPGNGDPAVFVSIEIVSGTGLGDIESVDCIARDDGEFSLPAATRAELGADFSGFFSLSRLGLTSRYRDGALLLVGNSSFGG